MFLIVSYLNKQNRLLLPNKSSSNIFSSVARLYPALSSKGSGHWRHNRKCLEHNASRLAQETYS